jgi:hypothetical protein
VARESEEITAHTSWIETKITYFENHYVYHNPKYQETLSLMLREEQRLRVFENRVLIRIFGRGREGVAVGLRRMHNEELCTLYPPPNTIRVIKSRRMR